MSSRIERIAEGIVQRSKKKVSGLEPIAMNQSFWSWEDDQDVRTATLFMDHMGNLTFRIEDERSSGGLGGLGSPGGVKRTKTVLFEGSVGHLLKPSLGGIRSALAKHNHERSRASSPFKSLWKTPDHKEMKLGEILEEKRNAPMFVQPEEEPWDKSSRADFMKIGNSLELLRDKFEATSEISAFLGISRSIAVMIARGNKSSIVRYCKEMMDTFGR
jgi:hypothetical protein